MEVEKFDIPFNGDAVRRVLIPQYQKQYLSNKNFTPGIRWAMLAFILVIMYMNRRMDWLRDINSLVFLLILIVYFGTSLRSWLKEKQDYKKAIEQMEGWIKDCEKINHYALAFNEENIIIWSDEKEDTYKWSDFGCFILDEDLVSLIDHDDQMSLFFPRASFPNFDVYDKLTTLIKKHVIDEEKDDRIFESLVE